MIKQNKTLIAGPWVGEFGWELFVWQAYIRSLSEIYDETYVICRKSSEPLYKDFTDKFINIRTSGIADSFFMYDLNTDNLLRKTLLENKHLLKKDLAVFKPRRIGNPPHTMYDYPLRFNEQAIAPKYIIYGSEKETDIDFVFHIRNRQLRSEDNWPVSYWQKLRGMLPKSSKIACIGTLKESGYIEGTVDLRGENLAIVFDVLRNARCCFGPSSGPMHLASLCGCPHVVWSTPKNHERYTKTWNPLQTKVLFDSEHSWQPSPESIFKKYLRWIDG